MPIPRMTIEDQEKEEHANLMYRITKLSEFQVRILLIIVKCLLLKEKIQKGLQTLAGLAVQITTKAETLSDLFVHRLSKS